MKKWEYLCVYYQKAIHETVLCDIGNSGWELVAVFEYDENTHRWIFKREKIEKAIPVEGD